MRPLLPDAGPPRGRAAASVTTPRPLPGRTGIERRQSSPASSAVQATQAGANAMGLGLSGNTLQALNQYGQGLAQTSYQQELQNLLNPIQIGQGAAAGLAALMQGVAALIAPLGSTILYERSPVLPFLVITGLCAAAVVLGLFIGLPGVETPRSVAPMTPEA